MNCQREENKANVMEPRVDNGEDDSATEVVELLLKVESLKHELQTCRAELTKLQKQLSQSERLQKSTASYNEDLRKQVDQLSAEIHERKKKDKDRTESETQTEEQTWTENDYYNYYYGSYYPNPENSESQETLTTEEQDPSNTTETAEVSLQNEVTSDVTVDTNSTTAKTEDGDAGSIADMLRATAEEAMTQTGFVFDETTGLYYDHSTGFYYDSASQLYYDANTGIYYCYDADSGRYQFHSKIEVLATQNSEATQDKKATEKKGKAWKKGISRSSYQDDKDARSDDEAEWVERRALKKAVASRKQRHHDRSPSPNPALRRKASSWTCEDRSRSSSRRKKRRHSPSSDDDDADSGKSKKKRKKSKSEKRKKKKKKKKKSRGARSEDSDGNSEPEEGEITESEGEHGSTRPSSSSSPSPSPAPDSPESQMEPEVQAGETEASNKVWPPCVRVTVVRSAVLQVGSLYIITADSPATIGREKDMDHAIRIPEIGVSKFHAEVYFDQNQQCYMLVDQGSQNGTVINGNRIQQPKTKCEPRALTHGDEVKMGETVLSFHIHPGTDTCDGCEPGQVMAHLSKHKKDEKMGPASVTKEKELLRQMELKQLKAKYGLQSSEYEEAKALKNPKYTDRAESRRKKVGSEGAFQRDDAPASVHVEISEVNKGRKMLEKMGWKKGEGLGRDGGGIQSPITVNLRKSQSGLGAGPAVSMDNAALVKSRNQANWERARERFADSCQADAPTSKTQDRSEVKPWVKAAETNATNSPAALDGDNQT